MEGWFCVVSTDVWVCCSLRRCFRCFPVKHTINVRKQPNLLHVNEDETLA